SRTAVAEDAGARSQIAGLTGACVLALLLVAGTGLVHDMPLSALAAVAIVAVAGPIAIPALRRPSHWRRSGLCAPLAAFPAWAGPGAAGGHRRGDRALAADLHPPRLVPARRGARPRRPAQGLPRHAALPGRPPRARARALPLRRALVLRQRRPVPRARAPAR